MTQIYVVGVGLEGTPSLSMKTLSLISQAQVLVGRERLLESFPNHQGEQWPLTDLSLTLQRVQTYIQVELNRTVVILTTGDPLFFGLGRLILNDFPAEKVEFIPSVSSVQLAFSRLKLPWQDATLISVHGRDFDALITAVRHGHDKIAILTDPLHSPAAIAAMILSLESASQYDAWVCENLGLAQERVDCFDLQTLQNKTFASLTLVVLIRQESTDIDLTQLPIMGISDACFQTFRDRPGLMTKREVRLLALGELALQPVHLCWDIGAGTGSMSIEMARLSCQGTVHAVEKSAVGVQLIKKNSYQFNVANVKVIQGMAPAAIQEWPCPDRVFIGGSGQQLSSILELCQMRLKPNGLIVLAIATLENFHQAFTWFNRENWQVKILHVQLSKSLPVAHLTRFQPLNPVYLITAQQKR